MAFAQGADIGAGRKLPFIVKLAGAIDRKAADAVLGGLRPSIDSGGIARRRLDRRRPHHTQTRLRARSDDVDFALSQAPADIAIQASEIGGRMQTPAAIGHALGRAIEREVAIVFAKFRARHAVTIRAALERRLRASSRETILHDDIDGAAQSVEPEHRIVAPGVHAGDGGLRDRIPVDGVAKGFVEPDAVLIDRDALGRALQRGSLEAVKAHVLEHAVALAVAEADTRHLRAQRIQHGRAMSCGDVSGGQAVDRGGHLGRGEAGIRCQRAVHHHLFRRRLRPGGCRKGAEGCAGAEQKAEFQADPQFLRQHSQSATAAHRAIANSRFLAISGKLLLLKPNRVSRAPAI